jgi:uncharacterized protein YbaP (TraB family)
MKLILSILFLCAIFHGETISQSTVWKVEGKGTTVYLGGTIHLLRSSDFPLPVQFDSAYAYSNILVFEADIDKLKEPAQAQAMMSKMMYSDGRTLKSVLSDSVYKKVEDESIKLGLPLANLNAFKASMVSFVISISKFKQLGITDEGVDKFFMKRAKADSLPLMFLETCDQQIDLISNLGEGDENEMMLYTLSELKVAEEKMNKMLNEWRSGTSSVFNENVEELKLKYPEMYKTLLTDRNNNWLPIIESYFNTKPVEFVLTGTLHYYGSDGIIVKLREKGYKVTQLVF